MVKTEHARIDEETGTGEECVHTLAHIDKETGTEEEYVHTLAHIDMETGRMVHSSIKSLQKIN